MRLPFPSEMSQPQDEDLAALAHPSAEHVTRSAEALDLITSTINSSLGVPDGRRELQVIFHHADHQGFLNPLLYTFHFIPVADDGQPTSPFEHGLPAHIVSMLNVPVGIQIEAAISSLATLVGRQQRLAQVQASNDDATKMDLLVAQSDERAQNQVVDVLRHGWRAAAEMVAREAVAAGVHLHVSYEPDAERGRDQIGRRAPALRHAYNEVATARDAVDRFVSAIATSGMIVSGPDVPESIRGFAQQHMNLGSLRYYLAQALRDAFVTGNGYLLFNTDEPVSAYNGSPERAVDLGRDRIAPMAGGPSKPGLHLRGLEQQGSDYGLGLMEVVLPSLMQAATVEGAADLARTVLSDPAARDHRAWAERTVAFAERSAANLEEATRSVFSPLFNFLPAPASDLYFPGREQM